VRELSLHILDALENSVEAGAKHIDLLIQESLERDSLTITVKDDGHGMAEEFAQQVLNPFVTTRTTRHVGLGLPLFAAAARRCNGDLKIQSTRGVGTTVVASFQLSHVDRAPLGDIAGSLMAVILSDRAVDVAYTHRVEGRDFGLDTADVRRELGDVPLSQPAVRQWLESTLAKGVAGLERPIP
jgi:signal transduction histidine kinase